MPLPMQPIALDGSGRPRFVSNLIVEFLLVWASERGMSLNELARKDFPREHREQFAQLIGYSVSGFGELHYISIKSIEAADRIAEQLVKKQPVETAEQAELATLRAKIERLRESLRDPVCELFKIHPDDLEEESR